LATVDVCLKYLTGEWVWGLRCLLTVKLAIPGEDLISDMAARLGLSELTRAIHIS